MNNWQIDRTVCNIFNIKLTLILGAGPHRHLTGEEQNKSNLGVSEIFLGLSD